MKRYVYARHSNSKLLRQQWTPAEDEYEVVATDGAWKCVKPLTHKAAVYFGRLGAKAKWDISYSDNPTWFNSFVKNNGPVYIFYNESDPSEKYAYSPDVTLSNGRVLFSDIDDYIIDPAEFISDHPNFAYLFE